MSRNHLVIPDQHAHPDHDNRRADYLSNLIIDLRPDVVINMGDAADMASLSSYDKGTRGYVGRTYQKDINAHLEFQDRIWKPVLGRKKKLPFRVVLEGNHEHRIEKALDATPNLEGTISFNDYQFEDYYDTVVRYDGNLPGIINVDGIDYAHYFSTGISGRPVSGDRTASTLLTKRFVSSTASHSHTVDFAVRTRSTDRKIHGLVAGSYIDYRTGWAGQSEDLWWNGVVFCRNVEDGQYDPQFISMESLKKAYG